MPPEFYPAHNSFANHSWLCNLTGCTRCQKVRPLQVSQERLLELALGLKTCAWTAPRSTRLLFGGGRCGWEEVTLKIRGHNLCVSPLHLLLSNRTKSWKAQLAAMTRKPKGGLAGRSMCGLWSSNSERCQDRRKDLTGTPDLRERSLGRELCSCCFGIVWFIYVQFPSPPSPLLKCGSLEEKHSNVWIYEEENSGVVRGHVVSRGGFGVFVFSLECYFALLYRIHRKGRKKKEILQALVCVRVYACVCMWSVYLSYLFSGWDAQIGFIALFPRFLAFGLRMRLECRIPPPPTPHGHSNTVGRGFQQL